MGWSDWITLGIAVTGALLGIFNTWTGHRRSTRRVRLRCGFDETQGTEGPRLWCEVVNPGGVPVTVKSVRTFLVREHLEKEGPIYGDPDVENEFLGRLDPGASAVAFARTDYEPFFLLVRWVTVRTADGLELTLRGRRLRRIQMKLRAALGERANLPPLSPQ